MPEELGLATFDAAITEQFGQLLPKNTETMGITTALSPQIGFGDRTKMESFCGYFGEDPNSQLIWQELM
jgi:beta-glucosidase